MGHHSGKKNYELIRDILDNKINRVNSHDLTRALGALGFREAREQTFRAGDANLVGRSNNLTFRYPTTISDAALSLPAKTSTFNGDVMPRIRQAIKKVVEKEPRRLERLEALMNAAADKELGGTSFVGRASKSNGVAPRL